MNVVGAVVSDARVAVGAIGVRPWLDSSVAGFSVAAILGAFVSVGSPGRSVGIEFDEQKDGRRVESGKIDGIRGRDVGEGSLDCD